MSEVLEMQENSSSATFWKTSCNFTLRYFVKSSIVYISDNNCLVADAVSSENLSRTVSLPFIPVLVSDFKDSLK